MHQLRDLDAGFRAWARVCELEASAVVMNSWILHITYKPPRLQVAVDIFQLLWCQVFHLGLKLDVLRFTHTWGPIPNKCNGVVLSGRFKAILQARAPAHGKKPTRTTWRVLRLASHPSIIIVIVILSSSSYRGHLGDLEKEDYQIRFQLTFLDWCRDRCVIWALSWFWHCGVPQLSWHLALMLQEEEAVGVCHLSFCEGMHWPNRHRLLFHYLLFWLK